MYGSLLNHAQVSNHLTQRTWPFVVVSAAAMVLLHPLTPVVITFAFITGLFLAYVYEHFAPRSQFKAFFHTATFHAAINLVGWIAIFVGWFS